MTRLIHMRFYALTLNQSSMIKTFACGGNAIEINKTKMRRNCRNSITGLPDLMILKEIYKDAHLIYHLEKLAVVAI